MDYGSGAGALLIPGDPNVRIVVVDPDEIRARGLAVSLESEGISPCVASGPEAVRSLGPSAHLLLVAASVPPDTLAAVLRLRAPLVLLDDGQPVPAGLVRAGPLGVVPLSPAGPMRSYLEGALERRDRVAQAERCEAALAAAGAGILLVGKDGRIERANAAYARLLGGVPRDPGGCSLEDLLHPEGGIDARERFREAVAGVRGWHGEALLAAGGIQVPCAVSISPIRSAGAEADGLVVTLTDVRDRRALEETLREANRTLERKAFVDSLTGLYNREFLAESIQRELARTRRHETCIAVLMIDLDRFKQVNDRFGHGTGDEVLMAVSGALKSGLREGDILARYGGDEFCALLPGADAVSAAQVAERVRAQVATLSLGITGDIDVRASIGLATSSDLEEGAGGKMLLERADRALLTAKRRGGDRVVAAGGELLPF